MDSFSPLHEFTRIYLALFFTFVAGFYTLRIVAKKRSGSGEVVFPGRRFCATWWNHMAFRLFRVAIWMVCLLRWPFPAIDGYLGVIPALNSWPVILAGDVLLTAGFVFVATLHVRMGGQWRSGIDPEGPAWLKTDGVYRFSRNPMFLGVAVAQVGFLLALPSIFSGVCLIVGLTMLYRQALAEEVHLREVYPETYRRYLNSVPRWL